MNEQRLSQCDADQWWKPARRKRIAVAIVIGMILALICSFFGSSGSTSILLRGDFPGFYAPAAIVASGRGPELYNPELQRQIENNAWPDLSGTFLMSVYPAPVAVVLAPLAKLPVELSRFIFSLLMFICWALTTRILAHINPSWRAESSVLGVWWIAALPIAIAIFGAQNSALSALLFVMIVQNLALKTPHADLLSGILIGVLCYKPQLAAMLILYLVCSFNWRALLGTGVIIVLGYLVGALVVGWNWLEVWFTALNIFGPQNLITNGYQMTSLWAFVNAIGGGRHLADAFTIFGVLIFGCLAYNSKDLSGEPLIRRFAMFAPLIVLLSPQALFYDLSLALVGIAMVFHTCKDRVIWRWWGLVALLNLIVLFKEQLTCPLFPIVAICSLAFVMSLNRDNKVSHKSQLI